MMRLHDVPTMIMSFSILFFAIVRIRAVSRKTGETPIPSLLTTLKLTSHPDETARDH